MLVNKRIYFLLLFSLASLCALSQEFTSLPGKRGSYSLVAYVNGGGGFFASKKGMPAYLYPEANRFNPIGTVRILWFPDHLIKVGLESGKIDFYSYRLKDSAGTPGNISLSAIPLILVWSMSVTRHFNIFAGSGAYLLTTRLDYKQRSVARKLSVGWMAAASYIVPLSADTGIGAEAKWLYAAETSNGSLCLQLQFVWKFLKW